MSGTPAIDSRSQNSFLKQQNKKTKGKANKKQKHVAVHICRCFFSLLFALFSHFFALFFFFFFFSFFFLGGYSSLFFFRFCFCCTLLGKKTKTMKKNRTKREKKQIHTATFFVFFFVFLPIIALCFCVVISFFCFVFVFCFLAFSFAFILCFFTFFTKHYLMVGHVWLPSPNINLGSMLVLFVFTLGAKLGMALKWRFFRLRKWHARFHES